MPEQESVTHPKPLTRMAHDALGAVLQPGNLAIDATLGNGHDSLFLARCVGASGTVLGLDVQARALQRARLRLREAGTPARCHLRLTGHEHLASEVAALGLGSPQAVTFNLGYLPGSDKSVVTRPGTTVAALTQALQLLAPGGLISLLAYRGHPGGQEEAGAVEQLLDSLDRDRFGLHRESGRQPSAQSPILYLVHKHL